MEVSNIIQLCYGVPGVFAYFLVIYAMFGVRKVLNRSFIVIFVITAAINIATWINSWLSLRMKREPLFFFIFEWFNAHPLMSDIHNILVAQFYYDQNICVLMLTIDRFAVIHAVKWNTMWWHKFYFPIALLSHMICIVVHLIARLPIRSSYLYNNETSHYSLHYDETINYNLDRATYLQISFGSFTFLICSMLNFLSLKQLVNLRRMMSVRKEVSFFLISFSIFLAQFLNLIVLTLISVLITIVNIVNTDSIVQILTFAMTFMVYSSDLFSIGPAFYTLLLPGPIRRLVLQRVKMHFNPFAHSSVSFHRSSS